MKFVRFVSNTHNINNTRLDIWVNPNAVSAVLFLNRSLSSLRLMDGGKVIDVWCFQEEVVCRLEAGGKRRV